MLAEPTQGNDEDEISYCNLACSQAHGWGRDTVGLHDWGRRDQGTTLGYACRETVNLPCDASTVVAQSTAMGDACGCNDGTNDCSRGIPKNCPAACADAVTLFEADCRGVIGSVPGMTSIIDRAVENCRIRERSGGTTYVGIAQRMPWQAAKTYCQQTYPGGDLAAIHTDDENQAVVDACTAVADQSGTSGTAGSWNGWEGGLGHFCWIGLNDVARCGMSAVLMLSNKLWVIRLMAEHLVCEL